MPKRGFTLIELLVVISIIAVLSALVMNNLRETRARTRDVKRVSDLLEVQKALELYRAHNGRYPASPKSNPYGLTCWECNLFDEDANFYDPAKLAALTPYLNPRPTDPLAPAAGRFVNGNNLDFQEYMIIPQTESYRQSVEASVAIYQRMKKYLIEHLGAGASNLGDEGGCAPYFPNALAPFEILAKAIQRVDLPLKILFGLDAAANNIKKSSAELTKSYKDMIDKFSLFYLEDPYKEQEFEDFSALLKKTSSLTIAGDDLTATNISRIQKACEQSCINGVVIKPNQIGTLSETLDAVRTARKCGYSIVVSHRSGETNDSFIADFAVGVAADYLKSGAPSRGERVAKYNRLSAIETELARVQKS